MTKALIKDIRSIQMLFIMAGIGIASAYIKSLVLVVSLAILAIGVFTTLQRRNAGGEAHLFAALIVGSEVYSRMAYVGLPWEFGKIAVLILLITGMFVEKKPQQWPMIFLLYGILLFPAIFVIDYRSIDLMKKEMMFNLSGQVCLIFSVFYFYNRKISMDELLRLGKWIIYGVVLLSAILFIKVPDYDVIKYGGGSNIVASGGFGSNQVAGILSIGSLVIGYFLLMNRVVFGYKVIDIGLFSLFTLQGLFTLSRGGNLSAVLSLSVAIFILYLFNTRQLKQIIKISVVKIAIFGMIIVAVFITANQISGGAVEKRYFNVDEHGQRIKSDYSTHRMNIVNADLVTFSKNMLTGAGVGGSRENRLRNTGISAVHVEPSRMLADHGILGLFALLIMIILPIKRFWNNKNVLSDYTLIVFFIFSFTTMLHNAMRMALPGFIYGLAFITIYSNQLKYLPRYRK